MSPTELEQILDEVGVERRGFLKKMILSMGYAAPIISVFSMEVMNMGSAMAQVSNMCSNLELQVEKTASTDPVIKGENLTYTIEILPCTPHSFFLRNTGIVTFSDQLPVDTTFISAQQTQGSVNFTLTTPAVGATGIVSGISDGDMYNRTSTIIEIVVKVLP